MSYKEGFVDALTLVGEDIKNYTNIETFIQYWLEPTVMKLVMGRIKNIKRELGLDRLNKTKI